MIADGQVIGETGLTADHHVAADGCAAGDSDLRNDDAVLAHCDIVCNLDEIVDFSPLLDQGPAERRAVDRHIGSQFNVVFDDDDAELRDLMMEAMMLHVSESVGSDHGSAMYDHPRTK